MCAPPPPTGGGSKGCFATARARRFHRAALSQLFATAFSAPLWIKIALARSVLCHFVYALKTAIDGCMNSRRFKWLHFSVALHLVLIVALAKGMFYVSW